MIHTQRRVILIIIYYHYESMKMIKCPTVTIVFLNFGFLNFDSEFQSKLNFPSKQVLVFLIKKAKDGTTAAFSLLFTSNFFAYPFTLTPLGPMPLLILYSTLSSSSPCHPHLLPQGPTRALWRTSQLSGQYSSTITSS